MSNDGNRICLDATPGNENIEVCDQYGNQVILHASKCRITLESPVMQSGIQLGKTEKAGAGVYIYTGGDFKVHAKNSYDKLIDKDHTTTIVGNYLTKVDGSYTTEVLGSYETSIRGDYKNFVRGEYKLNAQHNYKSRVLGRKSELTQGLKAEVCIGGKVESCLDAKVVCDFGLKTTLSKMWEVKKSSSGLGWIGEKMEMQALKYILLKSRVVTMNVTDLIISGNRTIMHNGALVVKP